MQCDVCGRIDGHIKGCPEYDFQKASHFCSICGYGIYYGDEYIENDYGEFSHWECINYGRDLVKWFGYEIKIMDN